MRQPLKTKISIQLIILEYTFNPIFDFKELHNKLIVHCNRI